MEINLEGVKRKKKCVIIDGRIERATETLENRRNGTSVKEWDSEESVH